LGEATPPSFLMDNFDLLTAIQPSEGWYAVIGIRGGSVKQEFAENKEQVQSIVEKFISNNRDVYFGVAKYKTDKNRTKDNVLGLKSFWIDIDCGEDKASVDEETGRPKGYVSQADGVEALKQFCKVTKLPRPIIVNSGRGIHAYWPITTTIPREQWEPVAKKLRDLCIANNFYIDPSVFEVARILRIPGTYNFKDNPPKLVEVLSVAPATDFYTFCGLLGVATETEKPKPKRELTELAKSMIQNMTSVFSKIMVRSAKGNGCAQLIDCFTNQHNLSEPRWFNALSIAKFCEDADKAIHKMSERHPDYAHAKTEQKIKHIVGPHTCSQFEMNNPGGCDGCPFKGKITSPIQLGKDIKQAEGEDNNVQDEIDPSIVYTIPTYPKPFFRGKYGGIYYMPEEEEAEPVFVYENDLYVVKRMKDPVLGDVVVMRVHMPQDGVKEFTVPNTCIAETKELKKLLSSHGVLCGKQAFDLLGLFIMFSIKGLQKEKRAEQMRLQFGWADNNSKFVLGEREITKDGVFHSPPSNITTKLAKQLCPAGSYEKWKQVFDLYNNEGLEPHAFAALTAFGAPLLKMFGQNGAVINVIYPRSGTGKTTILHMCNSVYGHPENLCAMWDDTLNAKIMRLGIMNNLPFTIDEVTNMTPLDFSTLLYSMSQGRGKDRVKASANELRANLTSWQTISLCSSNASFYEKLSSLKHSADGEMMRLIEYKIDYTSVIDPAVAKEMFDHQLYNNYGHAGEIYLIHLVNNFEEVLEGALSVQAKIDSELKLTSRERFWSAVVAANISGGLIARQLGIINWDMKRIYKWATKEIISLRQDVKAPVNDTVSVVGDYINRHINNILAVDADNDLRTNMPKLPVMEPKGELLIRYEPDVKKLYLAVKAFKRDCVESQINYKETLRQLEEKGIYLGAVTKRMSKGMKIVSPGVHALVFDASSPEFFDMTTIVGETDNEDRGSQL